MIKRINTMIITTMIPPMAAPTMMGMLLVLSPKNLHTYIATCPLHGIYVTKPAKN